MKLQTVLLTLLALTLLAGAAREPASAAANGPSSPTTLSGTLHDRDGDNRLERTRGDRRVVREALAQARRRRASRRRERIFFGQLSDFQTTDEESPVRGEFTDRFGPPFQDLFRADQGTSLQVVEQMVLSMRGARSPTTGRRPQLVMTTGDNADNSQLNETRWFIDVLDGGRSIDPNSGIPESCGLTDDGHVYDGVRGDNEYYEPDRSGPGVDGPGYSPVESENRAAAERSGALRDFRGLYEAQNRPFRATGLGIPWYGIFGNHDSLLTGNFARSSALARVSTGCVKVNDISAEALAAAAPLAAGGFTPLEEGEAGRILIGDVLRSATDPSAIPERAGIVPRDPKRLPLKKRRYIREHFRTRGRPDGHGFTRANLRSGEGNYTIRPGQGLRFIVIDSVSDTGGSRGNLGDRQFRWVHAQLRRAERRREVVFAFSHHSLGTMNQPFPSGFPAGDQEGDRSLPVHFGKGPGDSTSRCPTRKPGARTRRKETLRCLFLRHRSLVAFVNGHTHAHKVTPFRRPGEGGFWEITTASHLDWPQQSRLIELFDNRDGTLSIFGTILDHSARPDPGPAPLDVRGAQSPREVARLASISRELACNDPNSNSGEGGACASGRTRSISEGALLDRNVELLVHSPFRGGRGR